MDFFPLTLSLFAQIHEGAVWGQTTLPLAQCRLKMASVEVMPTNPHPTGTGGSRPHSPDGPICIGSLTGPPASPRPPRLGSGYKISPPISLPERRGAQPSPNPPPSPSLGSVCPCQTARVGTTKPPPCPTVFPGDAPDGLGCGGPVVGLGLEALPALATRVRGGGRPTGRPPRHRAAPRARKKTPKSRAEPRSRRGELCR